MKKLILFAVMLMALPLAIFAQDVPPPTGWQDILMNPTQWFLSFGAIAALTTFIAAVLNGLLKVEKKFIKQLVAWGVAIILLIGSDLLNFGYAKDFPILLAAVHGLGAGLIANGLFDVPSVKLILDMVAGWFKPKE